MGCLSGIAQAITNSCTNVPSAGLEVKGWIINRADVTWTIDADNVVLLTGATMAGGTFAYPITAVKKEMNAGFDAVIADNLPDLFTHNISFQPYERKSANILALDSIDDIVVVLELKGEKISGCFIVLGYETGLHLVSMSYRANDNNGIPTYEFATKEGQGEKYSRYIFWDTGIEGDYITTKALLVALQET